MQMLGRGLTAGDQHRAPSSCRPYSRRAHGTHLFMGLSHDRSVTGSFIYVDLGVGRDAKMIFVDGGVECRHWMSS